MVKIETKFQNGAISFRIGDRLVLVWKPCPGKAPGCFDIRLQSWKPLQSRFCPILGQ